MAGDKLALKLKQGAAVCGLSARQLRELGKAYCVQLKEGEKRVHFGPTAPFDRSLPWQQTNEAGNPVGAVKYFSQGSWIEGQILANPPSEGPTGPQGVKGDKGETGEKGDKGDTGDTGPAGADGEKGDAGPTGPQGIQGVQGPAGVTGPAGAAGTAGIDGVDGTDGTTVLAGSGAPGAGDGADEDFYVDLDFPYRLYGPKSGGVWGGGIPLNALGVPQDLSGGTALVLNSSLYDTFGANRTISAFPSLGGLTYAKITINAWVSVASVDLDFHTNNTVYEVGSGSTSALAAAVTINQGPNTLVLEYIDSRWLLTVN